MSFLPKLRLFRVPNKAPKSATAVRNVSDSGNKDGEAEGHIFQKLWTKPELIEYVTNNVHYEDGNYVIINKPYGVLSRINKTKTDVVHQEPAACSFTLADILPDLSERFHAKDLSILLNPERCFSGVTILSKGQEGQNKILDNFSNINEVNRIYSYLVVVLGNPPESFKEKLNIVVKKEEKALEFSKKKKDKGLRVQYEHEVLSSSKSASLVKVDLNFNYLNCVRLLLATKCLTPVLGDFVYSGRVTTLFDVPLLVPPNSQPTEKILRPEILRPLRLTPENADCCPCHIHLYSTMFRLREKKFVMAVPPPEYFVWTCERLGLELGDFCRRVDCCSESERVDVSCGQ